MRSASVAPTFNVQGHSDDGARSATTAAIVLSPALGFLLALVLVLGVSLDLRAVDAE